MTWLNYTDESIKRLPWPYRKRLDKLESLLDEAEEILGIEYARQWAEKFQQELREVLQTWKLSEKGARR